MLNIALYCLFAILFSLVAYKVLYGFLYDVTLRRLTKASFNISVVDFLDLTLAYMLGMIAFLFINSFLRNFFTLNSKESMLIIGLSLLFIGRIITRQQSIVSGKFYFSSIFIMSSIFLLLDFIREGRFLPSVVVSGFNPYTISNFYVTCINISLKYINFLYDGKTFDAKLIVISLMGVLFLSTFGEWCIAKLPPTQKSLMAIYDKLPSDFRVITGITSEDDKIKHTINSMFEGKIYSVRCVTKSLRLIELIKEHLERQYNDAEDKSILDYRIIRAPKDMVINDYRKAFDEAPLGALKIYMTIIRDKDHYINRYKYDYEQRLKILEDIKNKNIIKLKDMYLGDIVFLITEDDEKNRKILFIVKDKSNLNGRVGLYSEQSHLIDIYEHMFLLAFSKEKILLDQKQKFVTVKYEEDATSTN